MTDAAPDRLHNQPPDPLEILRENLTEANRDLLSRTDQLLESCGRMPDAIDSDELAGRFADQIKIVRHAIKAAEDRRKTAKEPHLAASRQVDAFFKAKIIDPLEKAAKEAAQPLTAYERKKAEEERKRREEAARAQAEAERKAREAAEAAAASAEDDAGLDTAIAAEEEARRAAEAAEEARKAAEAKNAELSRNRGEHGAVASLRTVWAGEIVDARTLDLDALRPHLSTDCLQKALNAYVRVGGRELRGARIYEKTNTVVR